MTKTYYDTLGVSPQAETSEIKKAYFELAKKHHPDAGNDPESKTFHELTEAYKTLTNKELRKAYDLTIEIGMEKIDHVQEEVTKSSPNPPKFTPQKRDNYRDDELREYHKNRLRKAQLKVLSSSLIFALIGALIGVIFNHLWWLDAVAALLAGISLSLRKNFELESFFEHPKKQRQLRLFLNGLIVISVLYFIVVFLVGI